MHFVIEMIWSPITILKEKQLFISTTVTQTGSDMMILYVWQVGFQGFAVKVLSYTFKFVQLWCYLMVV